MPSCQSENKYASLQEHFLYKELRFPCYSGDWKRGDFMTAAPPIIAAQIAQSRADATLSTIKQNAESDKQIADLLQSAISSVPNSPVRGVNVNIKA